LEAMLFPRHYPITELKMPMLKENLFSAEEALLEVKLGVSKTCRSRTTLPEPFTFLLNAQPDA